MSVDKGTVVLINGKRRSVIWVQCPDCGAQRQVRSDTARTNLKRCGRCSSRLGGHAPKPSRVRGKWVACVQCGKQFWRHQCDPGRQFCSPTCHDNARRRHPKITRPCELCGKMFTKVHRPSSNSSYRYCSGSCRDRAKTGRFRGSILPPNPRRRTSWDRKRKAFLAAGNALCFRCGKKSGRLPVHHIDPFRRCHHDDPSNLATLCPKCHSRMERLSDKVERLTESNRQKLAARIKRALESRKRLFVILDALPRLMATSYPRQSWRTWPKLFVRLRYGLIR
jgi:hypothetical protein